MWFVILVQLDISQNKLCGLDVIGRGTYSVEGIQAIADALSVAPSVTQVLAFSGFSPWKVYCLAWPSLWLTDWCVFLAAGYLQ